MNELREWRGKRMKKKYVVCLLAFSLTFTCISPTGTIVYASEMGSSSQQEEEKSVETNETAGQNGDFTEALDGLEQQESALEETTEQLNLLNVSSWNLGNPKYNILLFFSIVSLPQTIQFPPINSSEVGTWRATAQLRLMKKTAA